jgi:hypothetical protein
VLKLISAMATLVPVDAYKRDAKGDAAAEVASRTPAAFQSLHYSSAPGRWIAPLAIVTIGVLSYANSFNTPFVFDDIELIAKNPYIRHLILPWPTLFAPPNVNRPLIGLSFAINYAISGLSVWSYHALNLTIHIVAGLALFGVVRRTLIARSLRSRFGDRAALLAAIVAIIWLVHPPQPDIVKQLASAGVGEGEVREQSN